MNAIILAGGRGSRLEPWHTAKPLLPISGRPMLQRILDHLRGTVRRTVIGVGYRSGDIEAAASGWDLIGHSIHFSCPGDTGDVPMGDRLRTAKKIFEKSPATDDDGRVIILYGDELADVDIVALVKQHEAEGNKITFAAAYQKITGGMVFNKDKPVAIVDGQKILVNIGFAVVEPECWELLKSEDGLSDWINRVSGHGLPVGVYHHEGKRATVNSLADLKTAEEIWR